jgi:hypothetical protein
MGFLNAAASEFNPGAAIGFQPSDEAPPLKLEIATVRYNFRTRLCLLARAAQTAGLR